MLTVIILLFFETSFRLSPIIVSIGIAITVSVGYFFLIDRISFPILIYLQLLLDILFISLLVYFSGGIASPFYFLYILPIIVSTIFLKRRDTVYIATAAFISFGTLADLLFLNIIPFYPGMELPPVSLGTFIYNLLMGFIAFSSVAVLSSYYFEKIRKTGEELRSTQQTLQSLVILNNTVLERMEDGFITCIADGTVISCNGKATQMLNIRSGGNVFQLLFSEAEARTMAAMTPDSPRFYLEHEVGQRELGVSVSILGQISSFDRIYVLLISDLTERKRIERKLKEQEHLALIGEMSAGIAHEIRNPLASISGSVQFLREELALEPEYANLMEIIIRESERLSGSVNEFLNFAKNAPLRKKNFDLVTALGENLEMLSKRYRQVTFSRRFPALCIIHADEIKIKQMLWNLLTNAVKAVGENGRVECTLTEEETELRLSIRDNGVGIDEEDITKIFTPFFSRFSSGIGLGMAMVKRIVDEHGYTIRVQSRKNQGTEVILCMPIQ